MVFSLLIDLDELDDCDRYVGLGVDHKNEKWNVETKSWIQGPL